MKIGIRPAILGDARYIGQNLREADRQEVESLGLRPLDAVTLSFSDSDVCLTGCIDDVPALIFGAGGSLLSDTASVWALGTNACDNAPLAMVKFGKKAVDELLKIYPSLENYCDARYGKSLRWLKLLGFTVGEPEPYGPKKAMFCKLSKKRKEA